MATQAECFAADLERINAHIRAAGALVTESDGFQWIDRSKLSDQLLAMYAGLAQFGYANGYIA